jgi:hypothetical protein
VIIIGFWTVMTGMLVQSIWFPADSRLMKVDPGAVFQLIAARGEPSALDVYDDRRIVGQITILATQLRQGARHPIKLRLNGRMNPDLPLLAGVKLELESWAELDHGGEVLAFNLRLATGKNGMVLQVSQPGPEVPPSLLLTQSGAVLLDSGALPRENAESSPLATFLLGLLGISQAELTAIRQQAGADASKMVIEARQGKFDLAGRERQGFVVTLGAPGRRGFRMCIENTGEIVLLETPVAYQLVTESIRPVPPLSP